MRNQNSRFEKWLIHMWSGNSIANFPSPFLSPHFASQYCQRALFMKHLRVQEIVVSLFIAFAQFVWIQLINLKMIFYWIIASSERAVIRSKSLNQSNRGKQCKWVNVLFKVYLKSMLQFELKFGIIWNNVYQKTIQNNQN